MKAFNSLEGKDILHAYCEMLWSQVSFPYERLSVATRFGETSVVASGSGEPVILLHGSGMSNVMWASDIQALGGDFRVFAPDLPGEPGLSAENQRPFDSPDYADWLADVLDALSLPKAALVGASLGGWLGVKFAVAYPERAAKLALLCPAGIGGQNHAFKDIALSLLSKGEQGVDELYAQINGGDPIPELMLNYQKLIALHFNTRKEPIPPFSDAELQALKMPLAVFAGDKDILLNSNETLSRINRLLPHAQATLLQGRGHSLTGLSGEIGNFLCKR